MSKRRALLAGVMAIAVLVTAACGGGGAGSSAAGGAPTVRYGVYDPGLDSGFLLMAQEKQFWTKHGVNVAKVQKDAKSDAVKKKIEADMAEAREYGFRGTPSFLVGGVPVKGALPPEEFAKVIDRLLK